MLRPNGGRTWVFVGECYVHGIMVGEAMGGVQVMGKMFLHDGDPTGALELAVRSTTFVLV